MSERTLGALLTRRGRIPSTLSELRTHEQTHRCKPKDGAGPGDSMKTHLVRHWDDHREPLTYCGLSLGGKAKTQEINKTTCNNCLATVFHQQQNAGRRSEWQK